jgi:hypothetical protein
MEQQSFPKDVCYITDRKTIDVATRQAFPTSADAREADSGNVTIPLPDMCSYSYLEKHTY